MPDKAMIATTVSIQEDLGNGVILEMVSIPG